MNANRATESTNMEGSNGTNLKPIAPILFFNKRMKVAEYIYSAWTGGLKGRGVYILRADRKR